ncbi:MAG: MFS transporter [Thermoplasmatales archaeon]
MIPYALLLFAAGFGQYIIAPLIPVISIRFGVSVASTILLISVYGYATAILALLSGWTTHLFSVRGSFMVGGALAVIGLLGRVFSPAYTSFLIFDIIAAAGLPFLYGPMGAVSESMFKNKAHQVIGIITATFFLGLAAGAFLGPLLIVNNTIFYAMLAPAAMAVVTFVLYLFIYHRYPNYYARKSVRGSFKVGMINNWYIAFAAAGVAVMFGTEVATMLLHFHVTNALTNAGIIAGLAYIGSAAGSLTIPPLFDKIGKIKIGLIMSGVLALVIGTVTVLSLAYVPDVILLAFTFFFFGMFENALLVMAMASLVNYVEDPGKAGLATSMFTTFEFLGVGIVPLFLGPGLLSFPGTAVGLTILLLAGAFVLSFLVRTKRMEPK